MKRFLAAVVLVLSSTAVFAAVYDVGPGYAKTRLRDVSWGSLQPGDIVQIHGTPGGYHEKIQISQSGTSNAHIIIRGIPDPVTGALPVIDGQNALEDPACDLRASLLSPYGLIIVSPRKSTYQYGVTHVSFVDIENLDLRNAIYSNNGASSYTDQFGVTRSWDSFACGIYIEWAHDFAVRGCEISNCCNGIFANSKSGSAQSTERLLIEGNYFHDNSLPYTVDPKTGNVVSNGYHEHHCYTEGAGVIYQYNHFGKLNANAHGCAIKDRSSGAVVRYNDFDMLDESNPIALLDPQGGQGYIENMPDYRDAFVYGNQITIQKYTNNLSIAVVWWGAYNGAPEYSNNHRGVLYFFNNTIVNHTPGLALFFLPDKTYTGSSATLESVDCRNNIFYSDTALQSSPYQTMTFFTMGTTNGGGNINLSGPNWISPGWLKDSPGHAYGGSLLNTSSLIVGNQSGANNPMFVNMNNRDYHVLTGSNIIDAAIAPPAAALALGHDASKEYVVPQNFQPRVQLGNASDLGAVENSGAAPQPPPGGNIQFSTGAYAVPENAGVATIRVDRSGGATGPVSVAYSTSPGTATAGVDFTTVTGFLSWADGDNSTKTFTVHVFNDSTPENTETVQVLLGNVTGGAAFGTPTTATLTITDDDIPTSQPVVGVTATGKLVRFTTGAPGTLLSTQMITGLDSNQTIRGMAFRRSKGDLYVVGAGTGSGAVASSLYLLNPATAAATKIADIANPLVAHPSFDLGFDPLTEQLHLFGSTGQHLRLDPNTGALVSNDSALAYVTGDVALNNSMVAFTNQGRAAIVGADFTPGLLPTAYGIDKVTGSLVRIGSIGGTPQAASSGQVSTIGALGFSADGLTGLDVSPAGVAYASLTTPGSSPATSSLYIVDTLTGAATALGQIGSASGLSEQVRDIVIATAGDLNLTTSSFAAAEDSGSVIISVARTAGSSGQVSINYTASNGTATAGADYTTTSGTLTWQDGELDIKTFTIPITADTAVEGNETLMITLSNPTGGALCQTNTAILTINDPPYAQWKFARFGAAANNSAIAGDTSAPGLDGLPNLFKYVSGLSPSVDAGTNAPQLGFDGSAATLTFLYDPSVKDASLQVEVSNDLITWIPGARYSKSLGDSAGSSTIQLSRALNQATNLETITVQGPQGNQRNFLRLRATTP